ncbi:hypothetical protein P12x_003049 [Tundrisphaera lichenicola]|uniref:hypothetical protein n=1 Tax=Tundrisphaera lichenicola TaxID=2029860 RepID=UPI003EBA1CCE
MASYNAISLGLIFSMPVSANPKARQVNTYPGANGLEVIDHGSRGGATFVEGAIVASSAAGLASAVQTFRALQVDGGAYTLVDTLDTAWTGVILTRFQPVGRIYNTANNGLAQRYVAEFLHIT